MSLRGCETAETSRATTYFANRVHIFFYAARILTTTTAALQVFVLSFATLRIIIDGKVYKAPKRSRGLPRSPHFCVALLLLGGGEPPHIQISALLTSSSSVVVPTPPPPRIVRSPNPTSRQMVKEQRRACACSSPQVPAHEARIGWSVVKRATASTRPLRLFPST